MSNETFVEWDMENPPIFQSYWFEKVDYSGWLHYMRNTRSMAVVASGIYLTTIFGLQSFMKSRSPFHLQKPLIIWNLVLGIFSICGFIRMFPELWYILGLPNGFYKSVCVREGFNQPTAFWALLFTLSKYVELGDTLFIVLKKQPVIMLQWFHHSITLIFAWIAMPYAEPILRYYSIMNYFVHSIMYPYFAIRAMKIYIPWKLTMALTSIQLTQMLIAIALNLYTLYVIADGQPCARDPFTMKWSFGVYAAFGILFIDLFLNKYIPRCTASTAATVKKMD